MTSEKMESAMVELNATNKALIRVNATSAPISTLQTNCNNCIFNVKMTELLTYTGLRTLDAVTSFLSSLHHQFRPRTQELDLTDECGILMTNSWAAVALLHFRDKAAVWANHNFPVYACADVTWEDFSATVKEAFIPPDAVTRLKRNWESLGIKGGKHMSAFNQCFQLLRHKLEPHVPLFDKCHSNSYQFKLERNPEASKPLIEKLGNQPTVSLNDYMEHVSAVDAMLHSKAHPMWTMHKTMDGKQRENGSSGGCGGGRNDWCCYACSAVGHPTWTGPNKEKASAKNKKAF
jgi:hypothetical protein